MQPFRIDIPQAALDDLHRRLEEPAGRPNFPASAGSVGCRSATSNSLPATGAPPTTGVRPRGT
jgi:hypothetical protein